MKKLLLILPITLLLVSCGSGGSDELIPIEPPFDIIYTYVPDNNFEIALIEMGLDNSLNDTVLTAAIDTITYLFIQYKNISDLTGIENFTALTSLNCRGNQLTSLDVSKNTDLTDLNFISNQLTSLNVNGATALTNLQCGYNQLTSLDVSQNTALTELYCGGNQLTNLDVSQNTALTSLGCSSNELTSLDVSGAIALLKLFCTDNQLATLDVRQNTSLTNLECQNNQLTSLDLRNGNNTNLFVYAFNNPSLYCIDVDNETWANSSNWQISSQSFFSEDCGVKQ